MRDGLRPRHGRRQQQLWRCERRGRLSLLGRLSRLRHLVIVKRRLYHRLLLFGRRSRLRHLVIVNKHHLGGRAPRPDDLRLRQ